MDPSTNKVVALLTALFLVSTSIMAQPQLTLWKVEEGHHHHDTHTTHGTTDDDDKDTDGGDDDSAKFYACGSSYYHLRQPDETEVSSRWSIRNDGDQDLTITLPLTLTGATDRFSIAEQPFSATIAPGEEVSFVISYHGSETDDLATLDIASNDPSNGSCVLSFDGGVIPPCVDNHWVGDGDGISWEDPDNWVLDMVPVDTSDVFIFDTVVLSSSTTIKSLWLVAEVLTINNGVTLTITGSGEDDCEDGIQIHEDAQLINNGSIAISNADGDGSDGIEMEDDARFTNNGSLSISNVNDEGIDLEDDSQLTNNGSLSITDFEEDGINIEDDARFTNNDSISITDGDGDGINIEDDARFTNNKSISIDGSGGRGIAIFNNALFTNGADANIFIQNYVRDGILLNKDEEVEDSEGGNFSNDGTVNIISSAGGDEPLDLAGLFTNNGIINITGIVDNMEDSAIEIEEDAEFRNTLCGVINIEEGIIEFENEGGTLTNEGIIAANEDTSDEIDGTFTNNGQIVTPSGTYTATPNAVGGSGEVVAGTVPVTASLCSEPIPTMGEWGVIILGILLLIFSVVVIPEMSEQVGRKGARVD